jgi:hypothetical protein
MSLVRNHTGFQFYPLSSGSNDNPAFSQTAPTSFEMKNIPIAVGSLVYYVYGVLLQFTGNVVQAGGAGSSIDFNQLRRAIVDSLELRNAWHGTPISANHVKGSMLPIIETVGGGYCTPQVTPGIVPAANGTYNFDISVFVPLCIGNGAKPHQSAQLALFYKQAQLAINPSAAAVLTSLSTGATFTSLACRASAMMLPEPELRLGPMGEFIDYQSPASANQNQIALDAFGNVTGLSGTLPNAGVTWMGALTSLSGLPGSFTANQVNRYSFPFRGQVDIMQISAFVAMQLYAMGGDEGRNVAAQTTVLNGRSQEGFPFDLAGGSASAIGQLERLMFFPMVTPARDLELTKIQTAQGTQSYFLSLNAGQSFSGTNHTLVQHVRSWDDNKRADAVKQIVDSGLANLVLGQSTQLGWVPKLEKKNQTIDPEKLRYLPFRLVRQQPKRIVTPSTR